MEDNEFDELIGKAIDDLPQEFKEKLENVSVISQDWPSIHQGQQQVKRGETGLLLGLYEGVPRTRRGNYGVGGTLPDKITIFKLPLLMVSKSIEELKKNVKNTVVHEIGHHFGMNEEEIRSAMKRLEK